MTPDDFIFIMLLLVFMVAFFGGILYFMFMQPGERRLKKDIKKVDTVIWKVAEVTSKTKDASKKKALKSLGSALGEVERKAKELEVAKESGEDLTEPVKELTVATEGAKKANTEVTVVVEKPVTTENPDSGIADIIKEIIIESGKVIEGIAADATAIVVDTEVEKANTEVEKKEVTAEQRTLLRNLRGLHNGISRCVNIFIKPGYAKLGRTWEERAAKLDLFHKALGASEKHRDRGVLGHLDKLDSTILKSTFTDAEVVTLKKAVEELVANMETLKGMGGEERSGIAKDWNAQATSIQSEANKVRDMIKALGQRLEST